MNRIPSQKVIHTHTYSIVQALSRLHDYEFCSNHVTVITFICDGFGKISLIAG